MIIKKVIIVLVVVTFTSVLSGGAQDNIPDIEGIQHQLEIYNEVAGYLDEVFREFSEGYLGAGAALKKINVLKHEYDKIVKPVPEEAERLRRLVMDLLSQVENYFIYFKRANRENPDINIKVARARFAASMEAERLQYAYVP